MTYRPDQIDFNRADQTLAQDNTNSNNSVTAWNVGYKELINKIANCSTERDRISMINANSYALEQYRGSGINTYNDLQSLEQNHYNKVIDDIANAGSDEDRARLIKTVINGELAAFKTCGFPIINELQYLEQDRYSNDLINNHTTANIEEGINYYKNNGEIDAFRACEFKNGGVDNELTYIRNYFAAQRQADISQSTGNDQQQGRSDNPMKEEKEVSQNYGNTPSEIQASASNIDIDKHFNNAIQFINDYHGEVSQTLGKNPQPLSLDIGRGR